MKRALEDTSEFNHLLLLLLLLLLLSLAVASPCYL
jgi:hypothetical protein